MTSFKVKIFRFPLRVGLSASGFALILGSWGLYVEKSGVPPYILPGPVDVFYALVRSWPDLSLSMAITAGTALVALAASVLGGCGLAIVMVQFRWVEILMLPIAVLIQVTPIVAIAPLILIYVSAPVVPQLVLAFLVSFFPMMLNMLEGLKSTDRNHTDLMQTYNASRWQVLRYLKMPSALPSFFAGLKIASGLCVVGAVVSEFEAGSGGRYSGLAFRLLDAERATDTAGAFAAVALLAFLGLAIYLTTSLVSHVILRNWHESEQ